MPKDAAPPQFLITLACPDRPGIVAEVGGFLVEHGCNIVESAQYFDPDNGRFFLRTAFQSLRGQGLADLEAAFAPIAERRAMQARFFDCAQPMRTVVMVSRLGHCLNDLLFRHSIGALPIEVRAVVSNHPDFEDLARRHGVPFHFMPVTPETKAAQEARLAQLIEDEGVELIVLARYMQVLSEDFCARYPGRIINIHHSFLPSFKGAKPYHRAHDRGVKLIGATAHYVTADLDEGPIIEQGVERVRHKHRADDMVAIGRDVESVVLARAVRWHAEHRVLMNDHRTVVFE
ncbi:formyltetrahydrofolate deformylase [Phenylobacterium montanum]|uniref:Formyltetrahydrofolate deformylase n=1 Tax=Phenylobacterium montanum TaxID=2823693 RepID=A0A975G1Z6_9CAUL|nr:formyltetrahydrofolate deformylase [Caulobacter sp. S6]QUD89645.1 formyltetrahydrofolate deformylase [Caulobacter sp. S6]